MTWVAEKTQRIVFGFTSINGSFVQICMDPAKIGVCRFPQVLKAQSPVHGYYQEVEGYLGGGPSGEVGVVLIGIRGTLDTSAFPLQLLGSIKWVALSYPVLPP